MSYQRIKSIRIKRFLRKQNLVVFLEKSNNDTSPFKKKETTLPEFVINCFGGIYNHKNETIHSIISQMKHNYELLGFSDDLFFELERMFHNDCFNELRSDLREIFFRTCDKINNSL
jgi:hypothetical protein